MLESKHQERGDVTSRKLLGTKFVWWNPNPQYDHIYGWGF